MDARTAASRRSSATFTENVTGQPSYFPTVSAGGPPRHETHGIPSSRIGPDDRVIEPEVVSQLSDR